MPQEQIDAIIKQHKEALLMEIIESLFLAIDIHREADTITYTLTENTKEQQ